MGDMNSGKDEALDPLSKNGKLSNDREKDFPDVPLATKNLQFPFKFNDLYEEFALGKFSRNFSTSNVYTKGNVFLRMKEFQIIHKVVEIQTSVSF